MAPVHSVNSYSFSASSSDVRSNTHCNRGSVDCWELPISSRGRFFEDSFFENARIRYEEKVRRILDEWEETDSLFDEWCNIATCTSHNKLFRNLTPRNQEKQVISVTSEDGELKILLDVHEFTVEEIRVRVVGERKIEVEGHQKENKNEITNNQKTTNKFHYLISLPEDVDMDTITSAMSVDGILTICVPRKKMISRTFHQVPMEVKEHMNASVSSGSDSSVNFSEKLSDIFAESSSKSSSSITCVNVLTEEKETCEKSSQRTDVEMNDHQSSRQLREIQNSLKTMSGVKELKGDREESCDCSCEFKNTGNQREEINIPSLLENINVKGANINTSVNEEKKLEKNSAHERSCTSTSLKNLPVTRRKSISNDPLFENIKETCSISGDGLVVRSEIFNKKDDGMMGRACGTSATETEFTALRSGDDRLKCVNQQKQPNEFIVPIKLEDTQSAVHNVQVKEVRGLQNEQSLINRSDVVVGVNHSSLNSPALEDSVSLTERSESNIQQSESSNQRLEENGSEEQTEILSNSLDSTVVNQNMNEFQSDGQSPKSFLMMDNTITSCELDMQSNSKLQTQFSSNYTNEEVVGRRDSCEITPKSKDSLELQSTETDSSSAPEILVDNISRPNVSRNLSISKRGSFFTDSYFLGIQDYYLAFVREVLSKYDNLPTSCDEVSCYRNLRMQGQEENIAAITFEDENKLYFILDVYDIMEKGDIGVNVVDEKKIVVKEQVNDVLTNSFSKCLNIIGEVDTSSAEAALSSDGVLVISIPKQILHYYTSTVYEATKDIPNPSTQYPDVTFKDMTVQHGVESSQNNAPNGNDTKFLSGDNEFSSCYSRMEDSAIQDDAQNRNIFTYQRKNSADKSNNKGEADTVVHLESVDAQSINDVVAIEDSASGRCFVYEDQPYVELKSNNKKEHEQMIPYNETKTFASNEDDKDSVETMHQLTDKVSLSQEKILPEARQVSQKVSLSSNGDHLAAERMESTSSLHTNKSISVAVEKRGPFHEDTFFDGMQNYLLAAIREILLNYDMSPMEEEEMTLYRKLMSNHGLKEEHQTASVSFEDEYSYKVVVDAQKFMKIRQVTLSVLNDKVMEVSMEEEDEKELSKRYSKSFAVPDDLDINNAVCGISSDGILAIIIHKKAFVDDDKHRRIKRVICEADQYSRNDHSDISSLASANHRKIFSEGSNASFLPSKVSILSSSSAADSHISSASEMHGEVEERDSAETLSETKEGETQMGIGYHSKSDGNNAKWDEKLKIIQTSTITAEVKDNNDGNSSDEDDDSDASTVVDVPCSLEINSITDEESSTFSPNVNYAVTLAESPLVESSGLLLCGFSSENKISSNHEENSQMMESAKQLLQQSSTLSIHTVDESESDCDDSWLLTGEGISKTSPGEDYSVCNSGSLSSLGLSGFQETYCTNTSTDKAYSGQAYGTITTQSQSMSKYLRPDQEERNENSAHFSSLQSSKDEVSNAILRGKLHHNMSNIQMTGEQLNSGSGEAFGFSKRTIQANARCTTDAFGNQKCARSRKLLTVTKRGIFFEDSFFTEVHENFLTAMRKILQNSSDEEKCKHSSEIASYKCWRKQNPKFENQAVYISDGHYIHKVIIDVEGLLEDSMTVSVVDGKELMIEGQSESLENSLKESHVYCRSFVLPDQTDVDAITATLSSDGILFIISPKSVKH